MLSSLFAHSKRSRPSSGKDEAPRGDWLIEGIILRQTVSLFYARGSIGKSLLIQQVLTALALGKPWLGKDVPNCRGFTLFAEDPEDEVWHRQDNISPYYGARHGDLEGIAGRLL